MSDLPLDMRPESWSAAAEAYDRTIVDLFAPYAADLVAAIGLGPGDRLLEVAAGPGTFTIPAALAGAQVLATDYSPAMVERLAARIAAAGLGEVATTAVMDGQALDVEDASFDAVCCCFGLMFFPDQDRGCAEALRALRPAGRAGILTWAGPERCPAMAAFVEGARRVLPDLPDAPGPAWSLADPVVLAARLERAGFEAVAVRETTHDWHFASAEATWDHMADASPVFVALFDAAGHLREPIREAVIAVLRERHGDGAIAFPATANLATARRPA